MDAVREFNNVTLAGEMTGAWVVRQAENKHWYVNVDKFSTPGQLVRALDKAHTMGG